MVGFCNGLADIILIPVEW